MANDSTTSSLQSEIVVKAFFSPRPSTISVIRQFSRSYSIMGGAAFGAMIAN